MWRLMQILFLYQILDSGLVRILCVRSGLVHRVLHLLRS